MIRWRLYDDGGTTTNFLTHNSEQAMVLVLDAWPVTMMVMGGRVTRNPAGTLRLTTTRSEKVVNHYV